MNRTFWMCAVFWCIERVKCDFDITRWTPPEGLENPCPSKPTWQYYTINSAKVLVMGMVCDYTKMREMDFSWRGKCAQAHLRVDELTKTDQANQLIKVACLPQHHRRREPDDFPLRGSLVGASQSSERETRSSREHRRRKRQQWVRRCRRYGRYWHSVGAKIQVPQL